MNRPPLEGLHRDRFSSRTLDALTRVPRAEFVPEHLRAAAHEDHPLPIGFGQTISQPYIVAFMSEALSPAPTDRILEVGTGCGYQAAVLACLAAQVYSVEIVPGLADRAARTLDRLGFHNVRIRLGNGHQGWPEAAPFDGIMVTCAAREVPRALVAQLHEQGRMILPLGSTESDQELVLITRDGGRLLQRVLLPVRFVPMTGTPGARA